MTGPDDELQFRVPDEPRLGGSVRAALIDFYFNSWRLVPANALWGAGLVGVVFVSFAFPPAGLLLAILLAVPAAGIFRLAALIVRGESVSLRDALVAWRSFLRPALLVGTVLVVLTAVLGFNLILGLNVPEPLIVIIGMMAGWGLLATWAIALPFWPLLVDPVRAGEPLGRLLRLATALVIISPLRFGMLLLLMTIVLIASTIFFAALLSISVAFVALVVTRYTLPAADRLEQRHTQPLAG